MVILITGVIIAAVCLIVAILILFFNSKRKQANARKVNVTNGTAYDGTLKNGVDILELDNKDQPTGLLNKNRLNMKIVLVRKPTGERIEKVISKYVVVGREEEKNSEDLCIIDRKLSRRHCCFHNDAGSIIISDMNSTNHTYVNGMEIQDRVMLQNGDLIRIGSCEYTFFAERV
jgi:hypothetical protein